MSEEELHKTNFKESIKNTTIAFEELLDEYKENKIGTWDKNLFNFPNRIRLGGSFNSRYNK